MRFVIVLLPMLCASVMALAQSSASPPDLPAKDGGAGTGKSILAAQGSNEIMVKDLLGSPVMSPQGKRIGTVADLILDAKGVMNGLVISSGGVFGLGGRSVGVAAGNVSLEPAPRNAHGDQPMVLVRISEEELHKAPEFMRFEDMTRSAPRE